jgi:predicted RNase H-like HicB family nuclease
MKNELTVFPAIFTKMNDDGSYYIVDFIDLKNCTTEGETIQEAYYMAQNAMGLFLDDLTKFPKPTLDFSNIKLNKDQFISFIGIDMNDYRKKFNNKSVKKTLSIPGWLDTLAEKENINFSQLLQEAIKEKLEID